MKRLATCTLKDGELTVQGLSTRDIEDLGNVLREKLLLYEVKHFKPIGVIVTNADIGGTVISKIPGTNESCMEIFTSASDLIYASIKSKPSVELHKEDDAISSNYGYLVSGFSDSIESSNNSLYGVGEGVTNVPKALIKDVHILTRKNSGISMQLFCYRGSKNITFEKAESILKRTDYIPFSQVYDLTNVVMVKRYEAGDRSIKLRYKKSIDESVLEDILRCNAIE